MKKQFLCLIAIFMFLAQVPCAFAYNSSSQMRVAIRKYRHGNFTGCLQDCQNIVYHNPSNATAYYYMAMSYVQAGYKNRAIDAYSKVLSMKASPRLAEYATTGKRCLETPDQCHLKSETMTSDNPELDRFIASPEGLSGSVKSDFQKKRLESIRNKINSGKDFDSYDFRKFRDYSNSRSQADTATLIAQAKPTEAEIAAAMKVLNDAGVNYSQKDVQGQTSAEGAIEPYPQTPGYQSPEMAQLNMLMGGNGQSTNNTAVANMIPYMLSQNKNGAAGYSPQMMQAVIMNSMMTNLNFDIDNKDK